MQPDLTHPGTVLLDTTRTDVENRQSLLFTAPQRALVAHTREEVPGVLRALDEAVAEGRWVAGYLCYEAGYAFEEVAAPRAVSMPLVWFGVYEAPEALGEEEVEVLLKAAGGSSKITDGRFEISRAAYGEKIDAIKTHIHEGDVYQINFTAPYTFTVEGLPLALYRALRRRQRVPYAAWLALEGTCVLCLSPELFFRRQGDVVTTRPMKGTVRRGRSPAEDDALRKWLTEDQKSRAENLMIVDLLRNDLSKCCRPGTVRVPQLFATETYETLIQMTSTVEGRLQPGMGYADLFRALFPCGSVTGAPKLRAMQVIHALEAASRGVYCGAIGYAAPGGAAVFNVAIRTAVIQDRRGRLGLGSGVVWDSEADAEYEECLLKARFLTHPAPDTSTIPFSLIETMRWEGGVRLLDLHLERLRASARYFGVPFNETALREALDRAGAELGDETHRLRLLLEADGHHAFAVKEIGAPPPERPRVRFAQEPVHSKDVFLYHKTTNRSFYEEAYRHARRDGFYEVLFLNERGEVAEGSRTNLFIRKGETYLTPPVACGLLPGVYRRHLLNTWPQTFEQVLYPRDLRSAEAVYVCNAVWGLVEVELEEIYTATRR